MNGYYDYVAVAVLILIPLASITHFIPPPSYCLLADICNHTWIPECGNERDYDYRIFIDECDLFEYNCDYQRNFTITNYSDCFRPQTATCPPIPTCPACPTCAKCGLRMGDWVYQLNRKMKYDPTVLPTIPMFLRKNKEGDGHDKHRDHLRKHYQEHIHLRSGCHGFGPKYETALTPVRTRGSGNPHRRRYTVQPGRRLSSQNVKTELLRTPPPTTRSRRKPPRKTTTKKTTRQVIKTATTVRYQTVVLKTLTGKFENGQKYVKVFKGYQSITPKSDSDFLS